MTVRELIAKLQERVNGEPQVADMVLCIDEVLPGTRDHDRLKRSSLSFKIAENVYLTATER